MESFFLRMLLLALSFSNVAVAQGTTGTTQVVSSTTASSFPTMSAIDGFGVADGGVGSTDTGAAGGSSGSDKGSVGLSNGAIIGISVTIGLLIIGIVVLWALWFVAKRRQWNIRESIRRASRRVTGRREPATPKTPQAKSRRQATVFDPLGNSGRKRDVESGVSKKVLPHTGWLEDEKERSRSTSRGDEARRPGGKLGFAM